MKLIKETFLNLTPPDKKIKRTPITGYSGLYLEQNQTGFTFQYSFKSPVTGKYRFMKLARFKYGDAFNKKMLDNIVNQLVINQSKVIQGIDPMGQKKAETAPQAPTTSGKTVNQVFDAFTMTNHFAQLAYNTQKAYFGNYKNHVAEAWGRRKIVTIKRPEVLAFLNDIKSDCVHNSILLSLQAIQSHAMNMGILDTPFLFGLKMRAMGSRSKVLTHSEIKSLMISTAGWDSLRNICKMQLLVACRNGEVAGMRWEEIDMKAKTWTVPHTRIKTEKAFKKMERPHVLPILPKMSEILLQQRQHGTTGLVFPMQLKSKGLYYSPNDPGLWLKNNLGIAEGTHQLRRTAVTFMASMKGISEFDIKIMLNHAIGGTAQKYVNTQFMDRKIELFSKWHHYIDSLMTSENKKVCE